jgi:hypothetical protein
MMFKVVLYLLAVLASLACTVLLARQYLRQRVRLLLWSSLCFVGLTLNNIVLFADLIIFPAVDLRLARLVASAGGLLFLHYGFIWDSKS